MKMSKPMVHLVTGNQLQLELLSPTARHANVWSIHHQIFSTNLLSTSAKSFLFSCMNAQVLVKRSAQLLVNVQ